MAATSSSQEQEAAIAPPAAAPKRREWVQVEKGMLSRVLYPNPVCLLSVWDAAQRTRNVMTITWLTSINNQGGFICSVNCNRHTAKFIHGPGSIFVLSVPVRGMEELVLAIGGCSGANVDKFEALNIALCAPGGGPLSADKMTSEPLDSALEGTSASQPPAVASAAKKQKLSKQELARQEIAKAAAQSIAIADCVAHVLCRVETAQTDDGHWTLRCSQLAAWALQDYWDGKNFIPRSPSSEPYLTFLGSKVFGYVLPRTASMSA